MKEWPKSSEKSALGSKGSRGLKRRNRKSSVFWYFETKIVCVQSVTQYVVTCCVNLTKWKVAQLAQAKYIWTNIKYKNIKGIKFWTKCNTRSRWLFTKKVQIVSHAIAACQISIKTRGLALRWLTPREWWKVIWHYVSHERFLQLHHVI